MGIIVSNDYLGSNTIVDNYALDRSKLCEYCKEKRPEQVFKELKASGRMK